MKNSKWLYFLLYIGGFALFSVFLHSYIILNPYNYGRHWDWTFYGSADIYLNYLKSFPYVIKINGLGQFDVASISLAEYSLKFCIFLVYKLVSFLGISFLTIPVLNKLTVFLMFPLFASLGIWKLCKTLIPDIYEKNEKFFFLVAVFTNLLYTFSLTVIFDLHGGALNRQISTVMFPWFFNALFSYFLSNNTRLFNRNIFLISLYFITFDISNIFHGLIISFLFILFKPSKWSVKFFHFAFICLAIGLLNAYWLHSLFIGNVTDIKSVAKERQLNFQVLATYSSTFTNNLFMLSTPHNIIKALFGTSYMLYVPYFFLYGILIMSLLDAKASFKERRLLIIMLISFIFTNILTNGTFSVGKIYLALYSVELLGFIRSAVRYMPNLAVVTVGFFLFILRLKYTDTVKVTRLKYVLFIIPTVTWILFLSFNSNLIDQIQTRLMRYGGVNNEIGALYQYNDAINNLTSKQSLIYNVLPIPSWFSPVFVNNVYPRTSQGSDTDSYLNKGLIVTNGTDSPYTSFTESYIKNIPQPSFFSYTNTKYIYLKNRYVDNDIQNKHAFSAAWLQDISDITINRRDIIQEKIKSIDRSYFTPIIYTPTTIHFEKGSAINLPVLAKKYPITDSILLSELNENKKTNEILKYERTPEFSLEYKRINPTKYRVVAHNVTGAFPILFNQLYYPGWKLYLSKNEVKKSADLKNVGEYQITKENSEDQATTEELKNYIEKGVLTLPSEGSAQKKTVKFISKNFSNSIQNDNLKTNSIFETWSKTNLVEIPTTQHYVMNGYANGWLIDGNTLCSHLNICQGNNEGKSVELILEFLPQKNYVISLSISLITLFLLTVANIFFYIRSLFVLDKQTK